ncbi:MAG TPA: hypothetical protein VKT29_04960, partial [Terriglobales bacterium]|nr:hypothetical protein [Terriglobales bacterium]
MKPRASLACVAGAALIFCFAATRTQAQAQQPAAAPQAQQPTTPQAQGQKPATPAAAQKPEDEEENIFAPQPAPALPPGMTGSDANDPRAKLTP